MSDVSYQFRQCQRESCAFRFPVESGDPRGRRCPKCGAPTRLIQPAPAEAEEGQPLRAPAGGPIVEALLDNIRSTFNVGAMFRTADGCGMRRLHLSGITPTPANPKIAKTALGAEAVVPWSYHRDGLAAAGQLKSQGLRVWALECNSHSESLFEAIPEVGDGPLLLAVGNEVTGVDPGILALCERVVALPMQGYKRSLNVAIAFGIAAYTLRFGAQLIEASQAQKGGPRA